jgi:hypothetical protein
MMRRWVPPKCDCCGSHSTAALYESDEWKGLIVCAACMQAVTKWLIREELIEDNPFADALLATDEETKGDTYRVWYPTDDVIGSFSSESLKFTKNSS